MLWSKGYAKEWTTGARYCYQRGCNCQGCYVKEIISSQPCLMKQAVFILVKNLGAPEEEGGLSLREQNIIDAILDGCNTFDEIADYIGTKKHNVANYIADMYSLAEIDGYIYTKKRDRLPEFIRWVRGDYD